MASCWGRLALPLLLAQAPVSIAAQEAPAIDSPEQLVEEAESLTDEGSPESLTRAADRYARAARLWQQQGDAASAAEAYRKQGKALLRAGEIDAAVAAYQIGLDLAEKIEAGDLELQILHDLGYGYYRAGNREQALATLERQRMRARALGDRVREAQALGNMGSVYNTWFEQQKALDYYRQALALRRATNDREHMGSNLNNLGLLYANLGEPERALELFEEALAIHREYDNSRGASTTLRNLGSVYRELGELDRAAELYRESLTLQNDTFDQMFVEGALGGIAKERGETSRAKEHFARGLKAAREIARPAAAAELLVDMASVTSPQVGAEALSLLDEATAIYTELNRPSGLASAARERARRLRDLGRFEEALSEVAKAIAIRESIRAELVGERSRASSFGYWRHLYELWADILLRQHDQQPGKGLERQAFDVAEQARARGMLELLAGETHDHASVVGSVRRFHLDAVDRQISHLQRRLRTKSTALSVEEKANEEAHLVDLVHQREVLQEEIDRAAHDPEALLGLRAVPVEEVQALLPEKAALLEYLAGEEGSVAFVLTRETLAAHRLPSEKELESLVRDLRSSLESPQQLGVGRYAGPAHSLFRHLVEPVLGDLEGIESLIIAADGPLHQLPFEALLTSVPTEAGFVDQPYLLRRFSISYTPSASVLALLGEARSATDDASTSALVVAGPFATDKAVAEAPGRRDLVRSVFGPDGDWSPPPLVAARREADGIREALGEERVQVLLGDEATEAAVKDHPALTEARYLHFATHALVSQRDPALSAVVLALDREDEEDGLLQVAEIERLGLAADLVVLSACQTALGREIRGEGMLGLTRAFLAAGALSLIASLWSVADESTAELMVGFYGKLATDGDKAVALRQAKLDLIADETFAHPFYWAPFVLQGAPD